MTLWQFFSSQDSHCLRDRILVSMKGPAAKGGSVDGRNLDVS